MTVRRQARVIIQRTACESSRLTVEDRHWLNDHQSPGESAIDTLLRLAEESREWLDWPLETREQYFRTAWEYPDQPG